MARLVEWAWRERLRITVFAERDQARGRCLLLCGNRLSAPRLAGPDGQTGL
jgi:hypothetical protein